MFRTTLLALSVTLFACGDQEKRTSTTAKVDTGRYGMVELYDSSANELISRNAVITVIGSGYTWSEGPVWLADQQTLLFSDVPENIVYQWKENDSVKVYLTPSGYTDTAVRLGENGSNGLALDREGRLLLCQSGNRHVSRMNAPLAKPAPNFTILAANYKGKKFNSPNDLVVDRNGNIYFTDPIYGLPKHENDPTRELDFEGVYRIGTNGEVTLLIDSIDRPNGIGLSPDETTLYVGSSDNVRPAWYAYQLNQNGTISKGGLLLNAIPLRDKAAVKQGPDGFAVDDNGNIFSSGPDGVSIISPGGKVLALLKIFNRPVANCAFNETKTVLYVTADDLVLKVVLRP